MTNRTTKKLKKPLETTLGRAPSTQNNEVDLSHVRQPIETSVFGIREVLQLFETATDEVKNYVMFECDIMYECRTCRTIFRSLANFILHKRNYCKEKFNPVDYFNNNSSIQEPFQTVLEDPHAKKSPEPVRKTLNPIIEKLLEKQKVVQLAQRTLSEDLSTTSKGSSRSNLEENGESQKKGGSKIVLEHIESTNAAMFQTMLKSVPSFENDEEFMKNEVMEIHGILDNDAAVLGPDGKVALFETNRTRRNNPFYMRNNLFCTECQLTFITKKTLEYHIRTKHNNTRIFYHCPTCKLALATPWSVCRHLLKVHKMSNKQVRRMREQIHNSQVRKDQEPAVKKKTSETERLQETTDEENQWLNNLEGDNDLQMCGGCGKRFERKAALFSHSQMCAKRIAVCNAIKENNAKKKEEENAEKVKASKSEKQAANVILSGSQKRKPQFCRAYERKPDELKNNDLRDEIPNKKLPTIEAVYVLQSKGSDSPLSFKSEEQIDPLGINKEVLAASKDTIKPDTTLVEITPSNDNGKDIFKEDLMNNDVDFETFCDKMDGEVKQRTVDSTGIKILNTNNTSKKVNRQLHNTKTSAERCLRRLRSRDVIVEDDDIIFVGVEAKVESSTAPQISVVENKSCLLDDNTVPNSNNHNQTKKTYQTVDEESDFVGFSSEEQGRATKINGLCHLGLELDQDLSTLSYNNPLKRKREEIINDRRTSVEGKTLAKDMKESSSTSMVDNLKSGIEHEKEHSSSNERKREEIFNDRRTREEGKTLANDMLGSSSKSVVDTLKSGIGRKEPSSSNESHSQLKITEQCNLESTSADNAETSKDFRTNNFLNSKDDEEDLEITEQCNSESTSADNADTSKDSLTNDLLNFKDDDEDLEIIFSSFQNGNIGELHMYEKPNLRRRRGKSIDHRLVAKDAEKNNKWGETFISKASLYMNQGKLLCIPCNITYNSLSLLLWHMSAHFSWFRFQCSKCSFVSFNKFDCVKHAKETHNFKSGASNSDVDVFLPIPHWKTVLMAHDFQPLVDSDGLSGKHTDEVIVEENFEEDDLKFKNRVGRKSVDREAISLFSELYLKSDTECSNSSSSNSIASPRPKRYRKTDKIDIEDNSSDLQKIDNTNEVDLLMTLNVSDIIKRTINDEKYRDSLNLVDEEDCCSSSKSSCYSGDIKNSNEDISDREFYDYPEESNMEIKDKDDSIRSIEYNMVVEMVDYSNDKTERSDQHEEDPFLENVDLNNSIDEEQQIIFDERVGEVEEIILRVSENDDETSSTRDGLNEVPSESSNIAGNNVDSDSVTEDLPSDAENDIIEAQGEDALLKDGSDGCEKITIFEEVSNNIVNTSSDSEESDVEDDGKGVPKTVPVRMRPARNRIATLQKDFYYDLGRAVKLNDTGAAPVSGKLNSLHKKKHSKSSNSGNSNEASVAIGKILQSYGRTYPAKKK